MSSSPKRPLGGEDPYAPKRLQAEDSLSRGEDDDVLDDEPVGLRRSQLVAPPPLVGRPPQPRLDAPRNSRTARDVGLAAIVSMLSVVAVIAFYQFANTPPAPAPQLDLAATRAVGAAPAAEPAGPAAVQPAATALATALPNAATPPAPPPPANWPAAAATSPTQNASALAPADTRSPAAEPQPSEPRRAMSPEERQAVASLVARGKELLRSGDFSSARLVLERAADAGEPEAALTLGLTYDPAALAQLGIRRQVANIDLARAWYEKAQEFGSTEASSRIKTLPNY